MIADPWVTAHTIVMHQGFQLMPSKDLDDWAGNVAQYIFSVDHFPGMHKVLPGFDLQHQGSEDLDYSS